MKYSIDRIENDIAVLESLESKEKINVNITLLPQNVKEGSIIVYENNKYIKDEETELKRKTELQSRFNNLIKK